MAREVGAKDRAARQTVVVSGLVMCGGQSRRMGRDKARIAIGGTTLLERAVATVAQVAQRTWLGCGPTPRYEELGLPLALDRRAAAGPLAGLEAGLASAPPGWLVVLACDMPRVDAQLLERLLERARSLEVDACLLQTESGLEPLCALYHTRLLPLVHAALERGERKMTSFLLETRDDHERPRVATLVERELAPELRELEPALNVNTPGDLERAFGARGVALETSEVP